MEAKDKRFTNWNRASLHTQTLGINTHQWLVTVKNQNKPLGYLVIAESPQHDHSNTPTFVLLEYGLGEFTLFDESIAPDKPATTQYYDGFSSFWSMDLPSGTEYIDAKSGEKYPSRFKPDNSIMKQLPATVLISGKTTLTTSHTLVSTEISPFSTIDWITPNPVKSKLNDQTWKNLLNKTSLDPAVVTANLFQEEVLAPFTIGSVHVWDNQAYIGVWDSGLRFLPYTYIQKVGTIIQ